MVYEGGVPILSEWLASSAVTFLILVFLGGCLGLLAGFLVSAAQHGPTEGFYRTMKVLFSAFTVDFPGFSIRRTLAIAWLVIQESIRKRVLVAVFALFVVILLFAGWFLDPRADDPARLYLSFVLTVSNLLVILMSMFLATLSLPNDMKSRTIYTVVTKPVRASEIVLGRVIGFAGVGTALLLVMMVLSYLFVTRGLDHSHNVVVAEEERVYGPGANPSVIGYRGVTTTGGGHTHPFTVEYRKPGDSVAYGATELVHGHRHDVVRNADGTYTVSEPRDQLQARMPIYAQLSWLGNDGRPAEKGINVGNEWEYRHYITGGTQSAAIFKFSGIRREDFPPDENGNCIPLELNIRVFRTYKGDIEKNVLGSLSFRNPNQAANKQSAPVYRRFKEYETDSFVIPLKLKRLPDERGMQSGRGARLVEELDLFDDLVEDGQLEVILKCEEPSQYYGVAQADVYIRAGDQPFLWNFVKCFATMWMQMLMVVSFGVMFSTFLSGGVALLSTLSVLILGFFVNFAREIVAGMFAPPEDQMAYRGGGMLESMIRIPSQQNISTDLQASPLTTTIVQTIDRGQALLLYATTYVVPKIRDFDTTRFISNGYNIDAVIITMLLLQTLAYTAGTTLIAYFILKTREIAE